MYGVKLEKHKKMSITKEIYNYKKPKYVYIPIINQKNTDFNLEVKEGDLILKGMILGRSKDKFDFPIHSTVSGRVIGFEEKRYLNGEMVNFIIIENDFKEKLVERKGVKKNISEYTKKEFTELIKESSVDLYPSYFSIARSRFFAVIR